MSKFTPGPWRACEKLSGSENHKGWSIFADKAHIIGEIYPGGSDPTLEARANARLISAAPDLLEALTELVRVVDGSLQGYGMLEAPMLAAKTAIAKAKRVEVPA